MFTVESMTVQSWARLIRDGVKTREEVPNLLNLQEAVDELPAAS